MNAEYTEPVNEDERRALLHYYNSQTMTHGGYVIALTVGLLTLISRWNTFESSFPLRLIFYFLVSIIIGIGMHLIGKVLYWSAMADYTLEVTTVRRPQNSSTIRALQTTIHENLLRLSEHNNRQIRYAYRLIVTFDTLHLSLIAIVSSASISIFMLLETCSRDLKISCFIFILPSIISILTIIVYILKRKWRG